jgi:hypothetical protein
VKKEALLPGSQATETQREEAKLPSGLKTTLEIGRELVGPAVICAARESALTGKMKREKKEDLNQKIVGIF